MLGAEIFYTIGNEDKVQYLMREFGIPRERIFNSRDITFLRDVLAATNGRSVDVVLNSLSGELLHASWQCVAEFDCMVEVGKRDLIGKGSLAMDIFQLRDDASYLLVGGLGGIGQAIAVWMAEAGARELVFLSRSAASLDRYDKFVQELQALSCSTVMVSGSVADKSDVSRAMEIATRPIRGVMHMSMVLNDSAFATMAYAVWQDAMAPKVQGAWNIHEVLKGKQVPLDFLVLVSSVSGFFGQHGQANYAASNTFLDAFSQYRQAHDLPCAIIDLGVVDDIGYVSRNPQILSHFHTTSTHVLHESDVLESLQVLIARSVSSMSPKRGVLSRQISTDAPCRIGAEEPHHHISRTEFLSPIGEIRVPSADRPARIYVNATQDHLLVI